MAFGGSGFGTNSLFGASTPSSFFGQSSATPALFGASSSALGSSTPFGASAPSFGSSTPAFSSSLFGAQPQQPSAWGNNTQSANVFASQSKPQFSQPNMWNSTTLPQQNVPNTRGTKYHSSQLYDNSTSDPGKFLSISAMENFKNFSTEELRLVDYARGDKGGENPPQNLASPFGTQSTSAFGNPSAFAAQSSSSLFGSNATAFGASNTGGFGSSNTGGFGASSSGFGASDTGGFGASNTGGFGASNAGGFGASNTGGFGASNAGGFGASNTGGFGASNTGGFGASNAGGFGATAGGFGATAGGFGASNTGGFGASNSGGFGASNVGGFGASNVGGFGASSAAGFGSSNTTGFGASNTGGFGASAPSLFGTSQIQSASGFGAAAGFGAQQQSQPAAGFGSAFGNTSQPSAFGQSTPAAAGFGNPGFQSSGFGAAPASQSLFGATNTGQQSGGGLFGSSQPQSGGGLFGASSAALGASSAFGMPFGGGAQAQQSVPSLFGNTGGSVFGATAGASSGGLFGANSGASMGFGNTGGGLFGSGAPSTIGAQGGGLFGASSSGGLFGSNTGAGLFGGAQPAAPSAFGSSAFYNAPPNAVNNPQQLLQQGPLQASLTKDPFGSSNLFTNITNQVPPSGPAASVIPTGGDNQSQAQGVSVVVNPKVVPSRRTRGSETLARQSAMFRRSSGASWYSASPMRPWGQEGSVFNMGATVRGNRSAPNSTSQSLIAPWRTEKQMRKAANIKRLVIEPLPGDPILRSVARTSGVAGAGPNTAEEGRARPMSEMLPRKNGRNLSNDLEAGNAEGRRERPASFAPFLLSRRNEKQNGDVEKVVLDAGVTDVDAETVVEGDIAEGSSGEDAGPSGGIAKEEAEMSPTKKRKDDSDLGARYVSYKEFFRNQMSASRRPMSLGEGGDNVGGIELSIAPVSTRPDVYMSPGLDELQQLSREELSRVDLFVIGRHDIGEVRWLEPVDLCGVNLDKVVSIEPKEIRIYPNDEDVVECGKGLNHPAVVKLHGIWKTKSGTALKDAVAVASLVKRLKRHCEGDGLEFLGYDVGTGTWTFSAQRF